MAYVVSLKQFEGPLDLLLHLITRAKVDIKDIFVSEITEQYLASLDGIDELDMDTASEFLTMAATLLEIKSRAMLPKPPKPEEEGALSPEEELIRQLGENASEEQNSEQVELSAYRMFINQIETLTKTERIVFDLYIAGLNSHEIANKLNISINTIRTHNRNIYAKLNVTSYKEMMVYVQMMTGKQKN